MNIDIPTDRHNIIDNIIIIQHIEVNLEVQSYK